MIYFFTMQSLVKKKTTSAFPLAISIMGRGRIFKTTSAIGEEGLCLFVAYPNPRGYTDPDGEDIQRSEQIEREIAITSYNESNGETEFPTSFLGLATYIIDYSDPNRVGNAAIGDLIDGFLALGLSPVTQTSKILSTLATVSTLLSITGDTELAYLTLVDNGYMGSYEDSIKSFQNQQSNE
jgi:hypothetical protein